MDGSIRGCPARWASVPPRRRARTQAADTDPHLLAETVAGIAAPADEQEDQLATRMARCAEPLMNALPADQRDALLTAAAGELTQSKAAAVAGISTPGMKSRVQRARGTVRATIERCCTVELDARGHPTALTPHAPERCRCGCGCAEH